MYGTSKQQIEKDCNSLGEIMRRSRKSPEEVYLNPKLVLKEYDYELRLKDKLKGVKRNIRMAQVRLKTCISVLNEWL